MQRIFKKSFAIFSAIILSGFVFSLTLYAQTEGFLVFNINRIIYSSYEIQRNQSNFAILKTGILPINREIRSDKSRNQQIFLSPDRNYLAITIQPTEDPVTSTYITDLNGNVIVDSHVGSFVSWSPDSKKVLLYLAIEATGNERQIYSLGLNGDYSNFGLPAGTISANISPVDGSIAYSLTDSKSDDSKLYIRDSKGGDKLLTEGSKNIFAWIRWVPDGKNIVFMQSDLAGETSSQKISIFNTDSARIKELSSIQWNYPPILSPDGTKFLFANGGDIFEYDLTQQISKKITPVSKDFVQHPNYSGDGQTVLFSDGGQIWSVKDDVIKQITDGEGIKTYPISP